MRPPSTAAPTLRLLLQLQRPQLRVSLALRGFSTGRAAAGRNRIYQSCRSPQDLDDLVLASASSGVPLVAAFTASWCPACRQMLPIVQKLIEVDGVGEPQGGLGFAEIEYDAPANAELGARYGVRGLPTLLAFSRGEAQVATMLADVGLLRDPAHVTRWLETEAARGGTGGAGGNGGLLGRLFGKSRDG